MSMRFSMTGFDITEFDIFDLINGPPSARAKRFPVTVNFAERIVSSSFGAG
jgi:hypothetical protein